MAGFHETPGLPEISEVSAFSDALSFGSTSPLAPRSGGGAVATYVSLFMILFVFFIVLFSIATTERARGIAMEQSLDTAFAHLPTMIGLFPPHSDAGDDDPVSGRFVQDVESSLKALAPTAHPAGQTDPGTLLTLSLSPDTIFEPGTAALRTEALPVLTRLAVLLQRHRGDSRFQVALNAGAVTPVQAVLARARVTAAAARLYAEGCPADALTVSVLDGDSSALRLDFRAMPGSSADN